ncbi:MAG: S8 family serine peptidase [Polyangiaceae bacterium]|nr:S8 family serine peptidase [Polyangiaceae bacterium]MCW5789926.1 S8 family serine peptidase [Polyangiaceae bacterium]
MKRRPLTCLALLGTAVATLPACSTPAGDAPTASARQALPGQAELPGLPELPAPSPEQRSLLPGLYPDSGARVQVYLVLTARAPAEMIPRGVDVRSSVTARSRFATQLRQVREQQARVRAYVESLGGEHVASIEKVGNALHFFVQADQVRHLGRLADVDRVEPVPRFERSLGAGVPAVGAPGLWERTLPIDGEGIHIGVMDSGVDYLHAAFGGPGTSEAFNANDGAVIEPGSFPTAKVVGGWDFAGDAYNGLNRPTPDPDPLDCARQVGGRIAGGHGTHVAGIAAGQGVLMDGSTFTGPYTQSLDPAAFEVYPGVAPKALLHAIRIFGCDGSTSLTANAYDYAIDPDGDDDPSDRLDVLNASLGSDFGLGLGFQATLVENLTRAGTLFVAAAGNAGSSFFITGQPAAYPSALSVAATSEAPLPTLIVTEPESAAGNYHAVSGGISAPIPTDTAIRGNLVVTSPSNGCAELSNAAALAGQIAVVDRGSCTFEEKLTRIAAAGAVAAVMVQNRSGEAPFPMGGDGAVAIPAVMVSSDDGARLKSAPGAEAELIAVAGVSQLSPFSSRGPESSSGALKPEIAAPGGNIRSAGVGTGHRGSVNSGTSMASPLAAGAAALVRQAHPTWTPTEVKAALINTGAPSFTSGSQATVSQVGGGRVQVDLAVDTQVTAQAEPSEGSGVSFPPLVLAEPGTSTRNVKVTNRGGSAVSFEVTTELTYPLPGVSVTPSQSTVSIPPGSSQEIELVLSFDPSQLTELKPDPVTPAKARFSADAEYGRHFLMEAGGSLVLTSTSATQPSLRVPFNGAVRPASDRRLAFEACSAGDTVSLIPSGPTQLRSPVVGVFELGSLSEPELNLDPASDLVVTGAATDLGSRDFSEASAFIAFGTAGTWTTPAPNSFESFQSGFPGRYIVRIDTNGDRAYDYEVVALAASDVLLSYSLSRAGQRGSGRFVNIVPADIVSTQAYYNNVLVLPVFLQDLGLTEESPSFSYQVLSVSDAGTQADSTEWVRFDPASPSIDAAPHGLDGRPLFVGDMPIRANVQRDQEPRALVLHFDNALGRQAQIVDLPPQGEDESNLSLTLAADPAPELVGDPARARVDITHTGRSAATPRSTRVELDIDGGALTRAQSSRGSCNLVARTCDLGELAPGESATIDTEVTPYDISQEVKLTARLVSDQGCGAIADDDLATVTTEVPQPTSQAAPTDITPGGGGCSCRTTGQERTGAAGGLTLGLGLFAWLARRRRTQR